MHLGIIKITYNRTATHFMDDRFVNLGEEVILTLLWQSGASESATVCFVISLSICYWLLKCRVLCIVCVCVCVCVCERDLCANTYEHHHCVCYATLFPSQAWTDGKTKDIINCLYIYFESWNSQSELGRLLTNCNPLLIPDCMTKNVVSNVIHYITHFR